MSIEQQLADFVCTLQARDVPPEARRIVRLVTMAATGAAVAGAGEDGIAALRELLRERGGAGLAVARTPGRGYPSADYRDMFELWGGSCAVGPLVRDDAGNSALHEVRSRAG